MWVNFFLLKAVVTMLRCKILPSNVSFMVRPKPKIGPTSLKKKAHRKECDKREKKRVRTKKRFSFAGEKVAWKRVFGMQPKGF